MADEITMDGSVGDAALAIEGLLNAATNPAPDPAPDPTPEPNSPDPVPVAGAEEGEPASQAAPAADAPTAPVADPKLAVQPAPAQDATAALAEAAKTKQEAESARNRYLAQLDTYIPQLETAIKGQFADIKTKEDLYALADPASPKYDVTRYNSAVIAFSRLNDAQLARQQTTQEQQQELNAQTQRWRTEQEKKVVELIPELKDPEKGPVLARKLADFAKQHYTPQQLEKASAVDINIVYQAMRTGDLETQLAQARAKAAGAPTVQKPGTPTNKSSKDDKLSEDFARLQKSGRTDDAAAVFRNLM